MKLKIAIAIALIFTLIFSVASLFALSILDIMTGYDIQIEEPCVDKHGRKFIDEMCTTKIHCGKVTQIFQRECDAEV